ncbi:type II secretion system protein GspE [Acidaminobacter sp. JC074]|uniref:GspE/PulE family protein n=1 Tax=Acidaminobacter sp. JC074 TaxID=2530199 RepID=UPI00216DB237|nr:type II secretion system protein GspE [Acidaminobacter sp. JC074]
MKMRNTLRLGDLLVNAGKIKEDQLEFALQVQKDKKRKLGETLIELDFVSERDIIEVLEFQLGIPQVDLEKYYIEPDVPNLVSESFARTNLLIPIKRDGMRLAVGMVDPLNILVINDLEIITGLEVEPKIATEKDIRNAIDQFYSRRSAEEAAEEFTKEYKLEQDDIDKELLKEINKAPVVRLVNTIIVQAAQSRASDIHIEPHDDYLRIRFRVDGDLQEVMKPAKQTHGAIVTRIKIMAKLDIAERRIPQDGRIEINVKGRDLDLRVSTIPTIHGEKVVIRLQDRTTFLKPIDELGLNDVNQHAFEEIIKARNGIVLVTGPTGSGKSTSLYAMLNELNDFKRNVMTVEDPVEYRMDGITQSQVNPKAGFSFPEGLRSMLRQDPDVIMVGEIRDTETAEIAVRAAITGHVVLSTLHTNNAIATINRLVDMGIKPYLVSSSIVAIISQLLVKKICPSCKVPYIPSQAELEMAGLKNLDLNVEFYKGAGCPHCKQTGYRGRTPIFEILQFDSDIRQMVTDGKSSNEIKRFLSSQGIRTLQDSCLELVLKGDTTVDELMRISYTLEA